jgi:hypothetical protein
MDPMYSNRFGNPPYQQGAPYSDQQQPTGIQQPGYTGGFSGKPMVIFLFVPTVTTEYKLDYI